MENIVPAPLQRIRAADIIHMAGLTAASLGQEYCRAGAVQDTRRRGMSLSGVVSVTQAASELSVGTEEDEEDEVGKRTAHKRRHTVDVEMKGALSWTSHCTCDLQVGRMLCSHAAALLYQWLARPTAFTVDTDASIKTDGIDITRMRKRETKKEDKKIEALSVAPGDEGASKVRRLNESQFARSIPGPMPVNNLRSILTQLSLSELRTVAREYEFGTSSMSKAQLVEAIIEILAQSEAVRKVATTLEKAQRQLLAAITLAGGSVTDDDLRGLYERFSLGQPAHLQSNLMGLQGKALLFRASLNGGQHQRVGLSGALDIGWYVPIEVRSALRVSMPITPYDIEHGDEREPSPIHHATQPYALLADLLLIARALHGQSITPDEVQPEVERPVELSPVRASLLAPDSSVALPVPNDQPAGNLLTALRGVSTRSPVFLRFAIRLLNLAGILYKDEQAEELRGDAVSIRLHMLSNTAGLLLGATRAETLRDLFDLWLTQSSYGELYDLQEIARLRLRCRSSSLNLPVLRSGELETENSEARQSILALLTQAPLDQWINFAAFARFVYRLNPLFLQRRQRLYSAPHWWIEQEVGRPLRPMHLNDWLRAEYHYLAYLIGGPLYWWGICDIARAGDGRLLAFRLTPLAGWLLARGEREDKREDVPDEYTESSGSLEIDDTAELLVPCSLAMWSVIEVLETFAEAIGVRKNLLCYRVTPKSLGEALSRGQQPGPLLKLLRTTEATCTDTVLCERFRALLGQLEKWIGNFGRVRIYRGVSLVEAADTGVMREISATTSLDEQVVLRITPTIHVLKKAATERLIDELKRRGQTPLVHDEDYGAE